MIFNPTGSRRAAGLIAIVCAFVSPHVGVVSGWAQQPTESAPKDNSQVSIKFSVVGWSDRIEGLSYREGERLKKLTFRPFSRSETYQYTGKPLLELCREVVTDKGKPETIVVGSVPIPPNTQQLNVVVFPSGNDRYQAFPVNESLDQFPPGKVMIFNFTPFPVAVRINQKVVRQIEPGKALLESPAQGEFAYDIRYNRDGRWLVADRNHVTCSEDLQFSIFVTSSEAAYFKSNTGSQSSLVNVIFMPRQVDKEGSRR